eukprot:c4657_g1_i1 orf=1-243(-)
MDCFYCNYNSPRRSSVRFQHFRAVTVSPGRNKNNADSLHIPTLSCSLISSGTFCFQRSFKAHLLRVLQAKHRMGTRQFFVI